MREFMVELYVSRADPEAVERAALRTQRAAIRMSRRGTPVRYLRSIYVREDETCFLLYAAESIDAVREAARATGRGFEHVAEVIEAGTSAEGEGFEPSVQGLPTQRFSRPSRSGRNARWQLEARSRGNTRGNESQPPPLRD
jgi:hypothetical protein